MKAAHLGANLCLKGIAKLSQLPRGTILKFPSGAELMIEEYNPPCLDMSEKLASIYTSNSGEPIAHTAFSQAAKHSRGLVGVIEVAGIINAGDEFIVKPYAPPRWLVKMASEESDQ